MSRLTQSRPSVFAIWFLSALIVVHVAIVALLGGDRSIGGVGIAVAAIFIFCRCVEWAVKEICAAIVRGKS